ncbi:RNA-directed DNA polymerase, eukaryota [Tanacetum coccineum]
MARGRLFVIAHAGVGPLSGKGPRVIVSADVSILPQPVFVHGGATGAALRGPICAYYELSPYTKLVDGPSTPVEVTLNPNGKCISEGLNNDKKSNLEDKNKHGGPGNNNDIHKTCDKQPTTLDNTVDPGCHSSSGNRIGKKPKMSPGGSCVWDVKMTERSKSKTTRRRSFNLAKSVARRRRKRSSLDEKKLVWKVNVAEYGQTNLVNKSESFGMSKSHIISLNIRGMKRKGEVRWLKEIIRKEKPCVIGLQETKSSDVKEQWVEETWGSRNFGYAQANARGKSGGLLMLWDNNVFSGTSAFGSDRFIAGQRRWKGVYREIILVNV